MSCTESGGIGGGREREIEYLEEDGEGDEGCFGCNTFHKYNTVYILCPHPDCVHTLSTPMLFISSTTPSSDVFNISGGVCSGKVSLKCAELKRR